MSFIELELGLDAAWITLKGDLGALQLGLAGITRHKSFGIIVEDTRGGAGIW